MPDRDFTFEIEEHFGTISKRDDGWSKELNLVKWNGGSAKYDIREWDPHHEQMRRGITLTQWEMRNLVDLFISRNNHAAVARGRAIEADRNARRLAARQKAAVAAASAEPEQQVDPDALAVNAAQEEQRTMEGTVPPSEMAFDAAPQAETEAEPEGETESQEEF